MMKTAQLEGVQIPKDVLGWLRGLKFDAYVMGHEKTIDMPVTMMRDFGLFQELKISEDIFVSFLIDVRALHSRVCFTNWGHSVNTCHLLYYLLTSGNLAKLFAPVEVFAMFVASLCSGIQFCGNDPVVCSTKDELWMVQRSGSPHCAHYAGLSQVVVQTGSQPHCNIFAPFSVEELNTLKSCLHVCAQGTHVLPMISKVQALVKNLPEEEVVAPVRKIDEMANAAGVFRRVNSFHQAVDKPRQLASITQGMPENRGKKRCKRVAMKEPRHGAETDYELMQLMILASWLFYPTMDSPSCMNNLKRYDRELFSEGDKIIADMAPGADKSLLVAPCRDRKALDKAGAEERLHSTFVETVVLPLYRVLRHKTSQRGRLQPLITRIESFHQALEDAASGRQVDWDNLHSQPLPVVSGTPTSLSRKISFTQTQPLPALRMDSAVTIETSYL